MKCKTFAFEKHKILKFFSLSKGRIRWTFGGNLWGNVFSFGQSPVFILDAFLKTIKSKVLKLLDFWESREYYKITHQAQAAWQSKRIQCTGTLQRPCTLNLSHPLYRKHRSDLGRSSPSHGPLPFFDPVQELWQTLFLSCTEWLGHRQRQRVHLYHTGG